MTDNDRVEMIRARLNNILAPQTLEIEDESALHAGHPGARSGKGHFRVHIITDEFNGQNLLARHRRVYEALGDLMQTDIHALSISAHAPGDKNARTSD